MSDKLGLSGTRRLTLWAAADACGYMPGAWGTYKQWAEAGA